MQIKLHDQAELDNLAKQHGADKHARAGIGYSGKIIQSDDRGTLQLTSEGVIYHSLANALEVGKSYTLSHDDKTYKIQQNQEIRIKKIQKSDFDKG